MRHSRSMKVSKALRCGYLLIGVSRVPGKLYNAGTNGCGISGMQYVVRKYEDLLSGALVTSACRTTPCTDEKYTTGVLWARTYYFLQTGVPAGLHLVASCDNAEKQAVRVGSNAAEATWYGVAVKQR